MRPTPPPGEEAQIDYGQLGVWTDPAIGRRRRVWAFVMVLAYSRHMFVRPVIAMDQRAWTRGARGGVHVLRGVRAPDRAGQPGAPAWTSPTSTTRRSTGRMPNSPSTTGCWSTRPGRASRGTRPGSNGRCPMSGTRSGAAASSPPSRRCRPPRWPGARDVAGRRALPAVGRVPRPAAVFAAVEAERCNRCRSGVRPRRRGRPPRSARTSTRRSARRCTRCRGGSSGNVSTPAPPPPWSSSSTTAPRGHARPQTAGQADRLSHYPPEKIAFQMRTPTWCRTRPPRSGPPAAPVIDGLLEINALFRLRAAQGVLGLADKHGTAPAGSRLRQGHRGRRPVLPHHQRHPDRRRRNRPTRTSSRRRWRRRAPARPFTAVRGRHPPAHYGRARHRRHGHHER